MKINIQVFPKYSHNELFTSKCKDSNTNNCIEHMCENVQLLVTHNLAKAYF